MSPNPPNLEARVLVVDPDLRSLPRLLHPFNKRFGDGSFGDADIDAITGAARDSLASSGRYQVEVDGVYFTVLRDFDPLVDMVREGGTSQYSLVVYDALAVVKGRKKSPGARRNSIGVMAAVRKRDPLMPQMIIDTLARHDDQDLVGSHVVSLDYGSVQKATEAGVGYFASTNEEISETIRSKIFRPPTRLPNLTVVKMGGSATDKDDDDRDSMAFSHVCRMLSRIHQERTYEELVRQIERKDGSKIKFFKKRRRVNRLILTSGSGVLGNRLKNWASKLMEYGDEDTRRRVEAELPKLMAQANAMNLAMMRPQFDFGDPDRYGIPQMVTTGQYDYISKNTTSKGIPCIPTAPHWIMVKYGIPLKDSDTATAALAEFYGAKQIIVVKRTDGIYEFDPFRGYQQRRVSPYDCLDQNEWMRVQRGNRRFGVITAEDMLEGLVSREGTDVHGDPAGDDDHLWETSALDFFVEHCPSVERILVVHLSPQEFYRPVARAKTGPGSRTYQHIIVPDDRISLTRRGAWEKYTEKTLRDAYFDGQSKSMIVKKAA